MIVAFPGYSHLHFLVILLSSFIKTHTVSTIRDTDLNKSSDFLLNPVCRMLIFIITILLCKYLCIVQMK